VDAKVYLHNVENPLLTKSMREGISGNGASVKDRTRIRKANPPNNFLFISSGV
jgi:hypothetical protein